MRAGEISGSFEKPAYEKHSFSPREMSSQSRGNNGHTERGGRKKRENRREVKDMGGHLLKRLTERGRRWGEKRHRAQILSGSGE